MHKILNDNVAPTVAVSTAVIKIGDVEMENKKKMTSLDCFDLQETLATAKEANYTIEYLKGSSGDKGVVANGTMNWNLPINIKNEFNPAEGDDNRALAIRIYAVSNNGKLSDPVTQNFKIDTKAPIFGGSDGAQRELELVQFENGKVGDFTKITSRMLIRKACGLKVTGI